MMHYTRWKRGRWFDTSLFAGKSTAHKPVRHTDQLSREEEQGIMICALTIVSGVSGQQSTQQQKLSDN